MTQWGPVEQRCGTCIHYQPTRNPDTGRVLPSKAGTCGYPVEWPELPICFRAFWGCPIVWPSRYEVEPGTLADECAFWKEKAPARRRKVCVEDVSIQDENAAMTPLRLC